MSDTNLGFGDVVGLTTQEMDDGGSEVRLQADERHLNAHGTVHGGCLATLVDAAMGRAVFSAGAEGTATIELKITYLQPGQQGELVATAQVRKKGKRITVVEAEVTQDGETVALALGTFTSG
jgi:uncharacterized protein (TIGR00369 family)